MTNSQRLTLVRDLIRNSLADFSSEMSESILIRDGFYCGRRFMLGSHTAIWFAEDNQIKLYDADRNVLDNLCVEGPAVALERRKAA